MTGFTATKTLESLRRKARLLILTAPMFLSACAVGPDSGSQQPQAPAVITINTIPAGADISIQDNYVGVSPLSVPAPPGLRSAEPWRIEARLPGYEVKHVKLGTYNPPVDQVLTRVVESYSMIYTAPVGTKTIAAYYTLPPRIDIKLFPLAGYVPASSPSAPKSAPAVATAPPEQPGSSKLPPTGLPSGTYQARRNYSNGDVYVGEFRAGQLNGKGVYQFKNGDRYEGEFRNNLIDGSGVFTCANGKTINGPFIKLQPVGLVMNCR